MYSTQQSYVNSPEANWNNQSLGKSYDSSNVGSHVSGSISCTLEDLSPSTTYYYRAFVREYNESTSSHEYRFGSVLSFTTEAQVPAGYEYLTDYGMPDVSGLSPASRATGTNSDRDDNWYSFSTSSNSRQIAVHTYTHNNEETLNYVVLYDGSKYAPVWTAHTMNSTYWPNNSVGRNEAWTTDPAISLTQQSGLNNAGTVGYSMGHLVASEYRQSSVKQNKQTFYYSNQAPQWQNGFNGSAAGYSGNGIWQQLENRVVAMTPSGTTMLYVVTGVLYEGTITTKPSGSLNVPIPSHFYKCIMKCTFTNGTITDAKGIAFVYTNESHAGEDYVAGATSIDAIEARANFNFFANVPGGDSDANGLQGKAEANLSHTWFTGVSSGTNGGISPVTDSNWGSL